MTVIYSYGGFTAATRAMRSGDAGEAPVAIDRGSGLPSSKVEAFSVTRLSTSMRHARLRSPLSMPISDRYPTRCMDGWWR